MKIYKTMVLQAEGGLLCACDTIEYQGKLWLVPGWLAGPTPETERPAMLIGLPTGLPLSKPGPEYDADFLLPTPLSKATLAGHAEAQGYTVIKEPDLIRPVDKTVLH
jgi:hypothetical protein